MPYVYLIGWSKLNKWYYGVEFKTRGKNPANPANLWVTYFSSSKSVKDMRRMHGEPDVIQVRRVFETADQAVRWEQTVLHRLRVVSNPKWLNRAVYGRKDFTNDPQRTSAIVATRKSSGVEWHSLETRQKIGKAKADRRMDLSVEEIERRRVHFSERNLRDETFIQKNRAGREKYWSCPTNRESARLKMKSIGSNQEYIDQRKHAYRNDVAAQKKKALIAADQWSAKESLVRDGHQRFLNDGEAQARHRAKHIESLVSKRGFRYIIVDEIDFETYIDCATYLKVDPTTVRKWVKSGKLLTR